MATKTTRRKPSAAKKSPVKPPAPTKQSATKASVAKKKVAAKPARPKAKSPSPTKAVAKKTAARKSPPRAAKKSAAKKVAPPQATAKKSAKRVAPAKQAPASKGKPYGVLAAAAAARAPQRTVFIDVENTSHEEALERVLEQLEIDRANLPTEVIGVGNWRLVAQRLARRLAALGAQLVHSAPVAGVRDWSDLWIAVAAGLRLGRALPGDTLEIVSNDKAFDAVGDAAAGLGVIFRRITLTTGHTRQPVSDSLPEESRAPRRRRRGTRGGAKKAALVAAPGAVATPSAPAATAAHHPAPTRAAPAPTEGPHTATHEQITALLERLSGGIADRWVNLDVLENVLKNEGFSRPPGSQRLVTRLRRLEDIEVSPHGAVRLIR